MSKSESIPLIYTPLSISPSDIKARNFQGTEKVSSISLQNSAALSLTMACAIGTMIACFIIASFSSPIKVSDMASNPNADKHICLNHDSLQQTAHKTIPSIFARCAFHNRLSVEILKDTQSMFSYAYFPLADNSTFLNYSTWEYDKKLPGSNIPIRKYILTQDPVEVILYYATNIFRANGDLSDAWNGNNIQKIKNLELLLHNLEYDWLDITAQGITSNLTWQTYLAYPGPYGRVWDDGTVVTWSVPATTSKPNTELYLEPTNRIVNLQLWGTVKPNQHSTTMEAISRLIENQIKESLKRYDSLLALDPTGDGQWASASILLQYEVTQEGYAIYDNIDTYHKVRKNLRSLGLIIETYPEVIDAFYNVVPENVILFMNKQFNANINLEYYFPLSYGDIFGFNGTLYNMMPYKFTYSNGTIPFSTPLYLLGTMLFIDSPPFDHVFFGLSYEHYQTIRAVLLVKTMRLGDLNIYPGTLGCPASHASYQHIMANSEVNPFNPVLDAYIPPRYEHDAIMGTVCEVEDYFGNVHDLLVKIQQESLIVNHNFEAYTISVAKGLQSFLEDIDLYEVLASITSGLC